MFKQLSSNKKIVQGSKNSRSGKNVLNSFRGAIIHLISKQNKNIETSFEDDLEALGGAQLMFIAQ